MSGWIIPQDSSAATLSCVGGKGANLSELVRAGFAVPPGFFVSTCAYTNFVLKNRLQDRIMELTAQVPLDDPAALEACSAAIRAMFDEASLEAGTADAIRTAYDDLGRFVGSPNPPVAVRSSATAEDLPGLAFAGQQETQLNVIGPEALLGCLVKCWSSLWTARAIAYRERNFIGHDKVAIGVVVQQMVASDTAGVLFTANPLTGHRNETVIDASYGLGESIVSGQVDPDHYVVDSADWRIIKRTLGDKAFAIVPRADGGTQRQAREASGSPVISDAQIIELAKLAKRVESHFGAPQDIEWAFDDCTLYLLQARPITALFPLPPTPPDGELHVYVSLNTIQGITEPLTPLGINAISIALMGPIRALGLGVKAEQMCPVAAGRIFLDVTILARDARLRHLLLAILARADPGARQSLIYLYDQKRITAKSAFSIRRALDLARPLSLLLARTLWALIAPSRVRAHLFTFASGLLADAKRHALAARDMDAKLATMEQDLPRTLEGLFAHAMPAILAGFAAASVVDRWLSAWLDKKPGAALQLTSGIPGNVTTEMDLELWAAAQQVRADSTSADFVRSRSASELGKAYLAGTLPSVAQKAVHGFLEDYGMRAVAEIDIGRARWRDDPAAIIQMLRSYLMIEDPGLAPDAVFTRSAMEANDVAGKCIAQVGTTKHGWLRTRLLSSMIKRVRLLGGLREIARFFLVKTLDVYRTALLQSGRELTAHGLLSSPDDIFFVPLETLQQGGTANGGDLKSVVTRERAAYERECSRRQLPRVLLSTGEAFYDGAVSTGALGEMAGDAVSPGVVEGAVRVVLDPRGVRLEPGEILVCPATDPGWTPLFLAAGGLVMEVGGMATHGAVVAREYGLPAIVGVQNATTRLHTGQRIRVDGNRGRVTILDNHNADRPTRAGDGK